MKDERRVYNNEYRPVLYVPKQLTNDVLRNILMLIDEHVPFLTIAAWTELERVVVYDWAIREHLRAADEITVRRRRPKPALIRLR